MSDPDLSAVPVRDAATVMLVRDAPGGPEVFMLRRHTDSAFVGGAYVFPGGAVDQADRSDDLEPVCHGLTDAEASRRLGIDSGGLAYWVAAIRECFEEAGVLLASGPDGIVRFDAPEVEAEFLGHRRAVHRGERRLVDLCEERGLTLAADQVHYFAHWITPIGEVRRFDTRFFVARAPEAQEPLHDDVETTASLWVRPQEALDRHAAGELFIILPTIKNLEAIAPFDSAGALLAAAAAQSEIPCVQPRLLKQEQGWRVLLPGDPGYDDPS